MQPDDGERRQEPRAEDLRIEAIVLARHNAGVAFSIENISVGGALLVGPLTLLAGDRVQILFEVDGSPIDITAEVVRAERIDMVLDRIGVRFVDVPDETKDQIVRLVAKSQSTP